MKINKWNFYRNKISKFTKIAWSCVLGIALLLSTLNAVAETLHGTGHRTDPSIWDTRVAIKPHYAMSGPANTLVKPSISPTMPMFENDDWTRYGEPGVSWGLEDRSAGTVALATHFIRDFLQGSVVAPGPNEPEDVWRAWERSTIMSTLSSQTISIDEISTIEMYNLTGGERVYWGQQFVGEIPAMPGNYSNFRKMILDRDSIGASLFDPAGNVDYVVWSGYEIRKFPENANPPLFYREYHLYDLILRDGSSMTVPMFYIQSMELSMARGAMARGVNDSIDTSFNVEYGVSPMVNGLVPSPPMNLESNSEKLDPIAPFDRQVEMVGSDVGSGLNYDVVGAVTGETLTLGDLNERLTYAQSFVPDDDLSKLIDGNQYAGIGTGMLEVTITDYEEDATIFHQPVVVKTTNEPTLRIYYKEGATNIHGIPLPDNTLYDASALTLPAGGEEGWSNQPLHVVLDPDPITGDFDTVLTMPDDVQIVPNSTVTAEYSDNTPVVGVNVAGILTERDNRNEHLSAGVLGTMKIDMVPPVVAVTHNGGLNFDDNSADNADGSGISEITPPRIAFVPAGSSAPAFDEYVLFGEIPSAIAYGEYDVWVWARDKAGNIDARSLFQDIVLGGKVEIRKDTDEGAILHSVDCTLQLALDVESCESEHGCIDGEGADIEELSDITYNLYIKNFDINNAVNGTFEDYLPMGVEIDRSNPPILTSASALGVDSVKFTYDKIADPGDPNDGRWLVRGEFENLAANTEIQIQIPAIVPEFDKGAGADNIFRNQATITWEYAGTTLSGFGESNFALHRVTAIPSVETQFTKVGADALTTGLDGAEFALYRLDDSAVSAEEDIVDSSVLKDNGWTRIQPDGEDAVTGNEVFVTVEGVVDLGALTEGTYTLIETKAPAGYDLPVGQWILNIAPGNSDSEGDWKIEFIGKSDSIMPPAAVRDWSGSGTPAYRIINARPFSIGVSGLAGTRGLLLIGFALMATAGNVYIMKTYKQRKKSQ